MNNTETQYQWQFKNGINKAVEFTTFPYAYRHMHNIVRAGQDDGKPVDTSGFVILGPKNPRGERVKYGFFATTEMAKNSGLINQDGYINGKEFKKKF